MEIISGHKNTGNYYSKDHENHLRFISTHDDPDRGRDEGGESRDNYVSVYTRSNHENH